MKLHSIFAFSSLPRAVSLLVAAFVAVVTVPAPALAVSAAQFTQGSAYVLLASGSRNSWMSGSTEDVQHARKLRTGLEGLLYVREGATAYVIRDAHALRQARQIVRPQEVLGQQQAELGSRQAAIGHRQAAIGHQQAELGVKQAQLGLRQASATRSEEAMLEREQSVLGSRQAELGRMQAALARQQEPLARQQAILGKKQAKLAPVVQAKFRALLRESIKRGVARRVN